ncbi:MAG TPA: zinc ribbon domain-containing protein [Solirubrobacteraceae bacterium]|jgi:putative FmdB family regulatory protein|nr:zinc ribbon domain-containing protein [Solirubrobacteraceae bacterium]
MPIYEYRRPDGSTFEVLQSFSDAALTNDPETGVTVQRVLHAPAVHFKGKGFYNTDYGTRKRQRETAAAEASSSSSSSSDAASSSASDSGSTGDKSSASDSKPKADAGSSAKKAEPVAAKG